MLRPAGFQRLLSTENRPLELRTGCMRSPERVVTISDLRSAISLGVRTSFDLVQKDAASPSARAAILRDCVRHAGEGQLYVPVARTFPLEAWREALAISQSWQARGKLVLSLK